ncbi:MAG: DUF1206 domain-containing protein [Actinomycetota bacterium]|nr:DUF1206 domain-containing protein [Actinomycetota bacterium]
MTTANPVQDVGEQVAESQPMGWVARTGLAARALVYLAMGWLAVLVAAGGRADVDQRGVLSEVLSRPMGAAVVAAMALGFGGYAVWRLSEAAFGVKGEDAAVPRVKSLARGLAYGVLAFGAVSLLAGTRASQSGEQTQLAGTVMQQTGGHWLVAAAGVIVAGVGVTMLYEGWSSAFMRCFGYLPQPRRRVIVWLGSVGTVSRGIVILVTGALIIVAAWTTQPDKAGGIDEAFRTLLDQPYGGLLVAALGCGLIVFGIYGLAEAVWRRVPDGQPA